MGILKISIQHKRKVKCSEGEIVKEFQIYGQFATKLGHIIEIKEMMRTLCF